MTRLLLISNFLLSAVVIFIAAGAAAQEADDSATAREKERYQNCIYQTGRDPEEALDFAIEWQADGGDIPARHCQALALVALGRYGDAAQELAAVAHEIWLLRPDTFVVFDAPMRGDLLAQSGNAWLLAGKPEKALEAFNEAIQTLPPGDEMYPEFLIDRARAHADLGQYEEALNDLNEAKLTAPPRADIHTFRGSALLALERYEEAAAELNTALTRDPRNVYALLEHGKLMEYRGNLSTARQDWEKILEIERNTPVADAAQSNLERTAQETSLP